MTSNSKPLLFCFTYAGGNAGFYNTLSETCADKIKFVQLEYPGHGSRAKETLCSRFDEISRDLIPIIKDAIGSRKDIHYGLLGYSMGSIAAFDILKCIVSDEKLPQPDHVFLCSHMPKSIILPRNTIGSKADEWIKEKTLMFGGINERLFNNRVFWRMYLPIFRADYRMIVDYNFCENNFCTNIPVSLLYSETDINTSDMLLWKKYFKGEVDVHNFTGGHFFLNKHVEEVAQIVRNGLK